MEALIATAILLFTAYMIVREAVPVHHDTGPIAVESSDPPSRTRLDDDEILVLLDGRTDPFFAELAEESMHVGARALALGRLVVGTALAGFAAGGLLVIAGRGLGALVRRVAGS